jgi:hypothetical protein
LGSQKNCFDFLNVYIQLLKLQKEKKKNMVLPEAGAPFGVFELPTAYC